MEPDPARRERNDAGCRTQIQPQRVLDPCKALGMAAASRRRTQAAGDCSRSGRAALYDAARAKFLSDESLGPRWKNEYLGPCQLAVLRSGFCRTRTRWLGDPMADPL